MSKPAPATRSATLDHDPARMLIVDDDPGVGMALEDFFEHHGYEVTRTVNGEEALDLLRKHQPAGYDLVLLDVMLPGKDGFEVLEVSRKMGITTPILMVTARGEKESVLKGLGLGAEDYIVKPFAAETLLTRIERLLGRQQSSTEPPDVYDFGEVRIDFSSGDVQRGGRRLDLSEQQLDLLRLLVQHEGEVVSMKRLLKEAWGLDLDHVSFSVSPHIAAQTLEKHLRAIQDQIEPDPAHPAHLEAVPGLGYRFNA